MLALQIRIEEDLMNQSIFGRAIALQGPSTDGARFDALARSLGAGASRRSVIGGVLGTLGLGALMPLASEAKNRKHKNHKRKKKSDKKTKKTPIVLNQFGCVNVGGKCEGKDGNCCSGVCQGKKPEKGEADKTSCMAHNENSCTAERDKCIQPDPADVSASICSNATGPAGSCFVTTGNANFCANLVGVSEAGNCRACMRDTDCTAEGFPAGTACVQLGRTGLCSATCVATGGRICLPPAI